MVWEIILTWWLADGTVRHERYGAYASQEECERFLSGEMEVAGDDRWALAGFRQALGGCFPQGEIPDR